MGYPKDFKAISRKLTENIVVTATAFSRVNILNFGARMALFNYDDQVIVWSAIPYGEEVTKAIKLLTGKDENNVTYLVIPDLEHTMAAKSFKQAHPKIKIIASEEVKVPGLTIDHVIPNKLGNKLIDSTVLTELGIGSPISNDFEFVYLPSHKNNELVMFDKRSNILFEADLLFNLGTKEPLEQYSPETGFPKGFNPHGGLSYLTRYMQPYSKFGNKLGNSVVNIEKSKIGLQTIYNWDFHTIVMCHGNIIDKEAKAAYKNAFSNAF